MAGTQVTMEAVAREAEVSKATVSRALGGSSLIGEEVRERVEKAARKLGYVRKVRATAGRTRYHYRESGLTP